MCKLLQIMSSSIFYTHHNLKYKDELFFIIVKVSKGKYEAKLEIPKDQGLGAGRGRGGGGGLGEGALNQKTSMELV